MFTLQKTNEVFCVVQKQYGGAERCEQAARVIQQAYRNYQLKVSFEKIRRSKSRRLTIDRVILPSAKDKTSTEKKNSPETNNEVVELELQHSYEPTNQVTSFTITPETGQEGNQVTGNFDSVYLNTVTGESITLTTDQGNAGGTQLSIEQGKNFNMDNPPTNYQKLSKRKKRHG